MEKDSAEAETFRGMLRQMLFEVEYSEYQRVKYHLVSKGNRNPTAKEINKYTKATIPAPATLMPRLESLLRYVFFMDSCLDINEQATDDNRQRFFKPLTPQLRRKLDAQKKHVANGCLSDPSFVETGVRIHRVNPTTFIARSARSTGTNENDNMQILRILNNPIVGINRADRVINDHYEQSNERKKVNRLGETPAIMHRTEKIYWLNSLAMSLGFTKEQLPYEVAIPTKMNGLEEFVGMSYELPEVFVDNSTLIADVEGEPASQVMEEQEAEEQAAEISDFLQGINFDEEEDIRVDGDQFDGAAAVQNQEATIKQAIAVHTAKIHENKSTMVAFKRLTEQQPWVPFKPPDTPESEVTNVDREEYALFNKLILEQKFCRRSASLWCRTGYGTMQKIWDVEVANQFKEKIAGDGDDRIVLIHRKSYVQLLQHWNRLEKHKAMAMRAAPNNPHHDSFTATLRRTRQQMVPTQQATNCEPITCPHGEAHFGNPMVLNQTIAAAAVQRGQTNTQTAPFVLRAADPVAANSRKLLGKGFRSKKFCWRCGFKRAYHESGMYGNDCRDNVGREECSWCGWRINAHDNPSLIGPRCARPPKLQETEKLWYPNSDQSKSSE